MNGSTFDLRRLEEVSLNASATPRQLFYDGWLLRLAPGQAKRPRSVNAFYGSTFDLDAKLRHCAQVYAAHGLPFLFRITPFIHPTDLDVALEARGYVRFDETLVQVASLRKYEGSARATPGEQVELARWLAIYAAMRELTPLQTQAVREQFDAALTARHFVVMHADGEPAACGMALLEDGVIGLFNITTAKAARGRGHATRAVAALLAWGAAAGAHSAYLQVNASNTPALALYDKFAFATAYTYWYRMLPEPTP